MCLIRIRKKGFYPEQMYYSNNEACTDSKKADLFNIFFQNNFNNQSYPLPQIREFVNDNLCQITVDVVDVMDIMCNLDIRKAHGLDGIPNILYKTAMLK